MVFEGHVINSLSMFKYRKCDNYKQMMFAFFNLCRIDMQDVVENDNHILLDGNL